MADDATRVITKWLAGGYAHTMSPPRQPKKSTTVLLRWTTYWEPQCMLASKHAHDPADAFRIYRESYDRRVHTLFRAGIPWQSILRSDLDSPLQSGLEFDRTLCLAIARRESRMGRQKGAKRAKYGK